MNTLVSFSIYTYLSGLLCREALWAQRNGCTDYSSVFSACCAICILHVAFVRFVLYCCVCVCVQHLCIQMTSVCTTTNFGRILSSCYIRKCTNFFRLHEKYCKILWRVLHYEIKFDLSLSIDEKKECAFVRVCASIIKYPEKSIVCASLLFVPQTWSLMEFNKCSTSHLLIAPFSGFV